MEQNKKFLAYVSLVLAQIFWGISFVWTKELLNNNFNVVFIITVRLIISFSLLLIIALVTKQKEKIRKEDYKKFFLLAFFQPFLYFIGENYGLKFVDASYAAIFIAIIPIIVPFGLLIFYKQKINWVVLLGVFISIIGITIISLEKNASGNFRITGIILLLLAVFSSVGYNMVLFGLLHYKPITIIIIQNMIATIFYLPMFVFIDMNEFTSMTWNFNTVLALIMLAVFCSSIAFMGYSYAAKNINIAKASVFANAIPVVTIIFAVIIGQESITLSKALGITVVLSGVFISQSIKVKCKITNKSHL